MNTSDQAIEELFDQLALLEDSDEANELFSVLADRLLEAGDPRGPLVATSQAMERAREARDEETLKRLHQELQERREPTAQKIAALCRDPEIYWRWGGMVDGLRLGSNRGGSLPALFALPELRLLRQVHFEGPVATSVAIAALCQRPQLALDDLGFLRGTDVSFANPAHLRAISEACPRLRRLTVVAERCDLSGLALPHLSHLTLCLSSGLDGLVDVSLPRLRQLYLEWESGWPDSFARDLLKATFPTLSSLELVVQSRPPSDLPDRLEAFCTTLAVRTHVGDQLTKLSLPAAPSYRAARALVACHARSGRLREISFPANPAAPSDNITQASRGLFVSTLSTTGRVIYERRART